jgi:predicted transcriptional regulator of viral defense system
MKTRDWQNLLGAQAQLGKTLFTLTELANLSSTPRHIVNVEMTRLVKYGVAVRYAKGLYGLTASAVSVEQLLASMDPHAYITGAYALMRHGLVTQVPTVVTCFTTRRHFRREMVTPAGRIEFVCVKPPVYQNEPSTIAGPEQALCDFVYISLRRGQSPTGLLTFRGPERLKLSELNRIVKRYPATVRRQVATIVTTDKYGYCSHR